jgi:hypothetical protein
VKLVDGAARSANQAKAGSQADQSTKKQEKVEETRRSSTVVESMESRVSSCLRKGSETKREKESVR